MKKQKSLSVSSFKSIKSILPAAVQSSQKKQQMKKQKTNKNQQNKSQTIKQMYEYKIKNRFRNKNNQKITNQKEDQTINIKSQENQIVALKQKVRELQKQNLNLKTQTQRLTSIILKLDPKFKDTQFIDTSDFKKQLMFKLKNKQKDKIKTEPVQEPYYTTSRAMLSDSLNRKMPLKQINPEVPFNNNKFTMNLNMSFVNLDFDKNKTSHQKYNPEQDKNNSKQKRIKTKELKQSKNQFKHSKTQIQQSKSYKSNKQKEKQTNLRQLFKYFQNLEVINLKALKQFQVLLSKIFSQFQNLYKTCKQIYTQILQKIDPKIYVSSRSSIESLKARLSYKSEVGTQSYLMKTTINKISSFFKNQTNLWNIYQKDKSQGYFKESIKNSTHNFDINDLKSLQSSVCSFDIEVNPQKSKPVSKYHMQKLNQNLNIFMNFQNKKVENLSKDSSKKQLSSKKMLQTYFSKPVSSDISKKVSKNGSLNASLGGDK